MSKRVWELFHGSQFEEQFFREMEAGSTAAQIAQLPGMPKPRTVGDWLRQGKALMDSGATQDEPLVDFRHRYFSIKAQDPKLMVFLANRADHLLEQLIVGRSLTDICKHDEGMPSTSTIRKYLMEADKIIAEGTEHYNNHHRHLANFSRRYTAARERQIDAMLDDCLLIADQAQNDYMANQHGELTKVCHENIKRSQLRVETRMKLASMIMPDKYGVNPRLISQRNIQINNNTQTNITTVVKRAEERTRKLPSELIEGG